MTIESLSIRLAALSGAAKRRIMPWLRGRFPRVANARRAVRIRRERALFATLPRSDVFRVICEMHLWGGESLSGVGSSAAATMEIRKGLPGLIERYGVRSMLDLPCGDYNWMRLTALDLEEYIGADIVDQLITNNQAIYGASDGSRRFIRLDLLTDPVPRVDLVLCRDCLVHLPLADVRVALNSIVNSGSRYLLTTVFLGTRVNIDTYTGGWRPLNLQCPPFNLCAPLTVIHEPTADCPDKALGLWDLRGVREVPYA